MLHFIGGYTIQYYLASALCIITCLSFQALLHSMHKYYLRLVIEEERKPIPGEPKMPPRLIMSIEFPETTFIAVTAYQNEEVGVAVMGVVSVA